MPAIRIKDLAEAMIRELAPLYGHHVDDIKIEIIGFKPGEKIYEELMSQEEIRRTFELPKYFVVLPAFRSLYRSVDYDYENVISNKVKKQYRSDKEIPLSQKQLNVFISENNLMDETITERFYPANRYWPENGIKT
jgi:FlaA1/EpsC-like NDP-sugar epimerase